MNGGIREEEREKEMIERKRKNCQRQKKEDEKK